MGIRNRSQAGYGNVKGCVGYGRRFRRPPARGLSFEVHLPPANSSLTRFAFSIAASGVSRQQTNSSAAYRM
jgi:hypothetical protein